MTKFSTRLSSKQDELPELTGGAYNFIRKFAGITWLQLAAIEGLRSRAICNRKNLSRVKPTQVFYLYRGIFTKFGNSVFFWRGLDEHNKAILKARPDYLQNNY